MENKTFASCMGFLQAQFGAVSKERIDGLFLALSDINDADFTEATKSILKTFHPTSACPFPVPADFYEASGEDPEAQAEGAIRQIVDAIQTHGAYRSIDFGDEINSTIARFGGWPAICHWSDEEWNINEGRMKASLIYSFRYGAGESCGHLVGIAEGRNGEIRGDLVRIGDGKRRLAIEDKTKTCQFIDDLTTNIGRSMD